MLPLVFGIVVGGIVVTASSHVGSEAIFSPENRLQPRRYSYRMKVCIDKCGRSFMKLDGPKT